MDSYSYDGGVLLHRPCHLTCTGSVTHPVQLYVGSLCITCSVVLYVRCFTDMPCTVICVDFVLHTLWYLFVRVYLTVTHPVLFYVGSLSYTPCAILCGEYLLFVFYFFLYMAHAVLCGKFLLHTPCCFIVCVCWWWWGGGGGRSLILLVLFLCRKFVFHSLCYFISRISLTHPVGRFSKSMPCVLSCEEFLLYFPCCFMWEVSLTILRPMY